MDKITRLSKNEFNNLLRKAKRIGEASSESIIYDLRNGFILKDLMDESLLYFKSPEEMIYKEEDLLRFSDVDVKSYYFTKSVMYVDNDLRCAIMRKCNGYVVNYIDPLSVTLSLLLKAIDDFTEDTKEISKQHILGYDMLSNFMFDGVKFGAIDTIHYSFSDKDENKIFNHNISYFNEEVARFITELYFKKFVLQDKELSEMYNSIETGEFKDLKNYAKTFAKKLSEYCDKDIIYLSDASKAIKENDDMTYPCCPIYKLKK